MSELSMHRYDDSLEPRAQHRQTDQYLGSPIKQNDLFMTLIGSLSILRLRNINLHWNTITFSNKFTELHLQSVVLGDHLALNELLRVLESAPELRNVRLIDVVAFTGQSCHQKTTPAKISCPKLQSLLLDDLSFNVLEHVLTSIPPRTHQLKVGLTTKSQEIQLSEDDSDWGDSVFELCNRSNINTPFLSPYDRESSWVDREELSAQLESLPFLKTLIMDSWKWNLGAILALERSGYSDFPNLTRLCILGGYTTDAELLPRAVASHSLQTLVLDSHPTTLVSDTRVHILRALKSIVPDFRVVRGMEQMDEFNYYTWRFR